MAVDLRVVGTRPFRSDAVDKVTGAARFADDVHLPRMLHGKVLRSPHPHARIVSIDFAAAEALPGVHRVITAADLPELSVTIVPHGAVTTVDMKDYSENCMARERVLYDGHVLAAVAADDPHTAEYAVDLIEVTYEKIAPILDVDSAMQDGAEVIHETFTPGAFIKPSQRVMPNAGHVLLDIGDSETAFSQCNVVVEREYNTANVHQGYIEPHSATVTWNAQGDVTIWTSTQGHFIVREQVATILGLPINKIKVIPLEIGGGFGGKDVVYLEPLAAVLARETRRPVKMAMSRADMLRATGPAPATNIRVKLGAKTDGTLVAADIYMAYEAGAFPGGPVACAMMSSTARYRIPHVTVNGYDVLLNKPKTKQYRAPGGLPINFAMESTIDILAAEIGMDALDLRLKNAMVEGDRTVSGMPCQKIGSLDFLNTIKFHPHYNAPLEGPYMGRGMAYGLWFGASAISSVRLSLNEDGTFSLATGSPDLSGTRTTLAMQAAETLGINLEDISATIPDTDSIPLTFMSVGSRTTYATGVAVHEAALKLLEDIRKTAAEIWDVPPQKVEIDCGIIRCADGSNRSNNFREFAHHANCMGLSFSRQVTMTPKPNGWQLAAYLVDVEVDRSTGKVDILRATAFQDAGKAVHPDFVAGQMQGGSAQGLGWALHEEYCYSEDGRLLNTSLLDYRIPTALDLPMIETVILETPNPNHPYGVRGVGESSILTPAGAIANAIHDAIGVRMYQLPMSPRYVLEQIWAQIGVRN